MASVRQKRIRDVVTIGQFWRHRDTQEPIYITQVYRKEKRALALWYRRGEVLDGPQQDYVTFKTLRNHFDLCGPEPRL